MYTAKVIKKGFVNNAYTVHVEFSNGTNTVQEHCSPQNRAEYYRWRDSRLEHYNSSEVLETELVIGDVTTQTEQPIAPEPTAEEIARNEWLRKFRRLEVLNRMITAGITLTANEQKAVNDLKAELSSIPSALKLEYSNHLL